MAPPAPPPPAPSSPGVVGGVTPPALKRPTPRTGVLGSKKVSAGVGSEIYVVGSSPHPTTVEGWIDVVEPLDGDVERTTWTGQFPSVDLAYMHPSTLVVTGYGQGVIGARAFTEMLVPLWTAEEPIVPGDDVVVSVDDPELERRRTSVHDENTHQHRLR